MPRTGGSYWDALRVMRDLRCPTCGLQIGVAVTAWKGRGAGVGGSHFAATKVAAPAPETVCQCPRETPDEKRTGDGDL